ncbi:hypothetical protein HXX76_002583 [Chlamydomonas incerta]|uniref:Beta-lactamase-related domain-containing protein n=1 Tax=Chlamydomonas incerta TaxID=51695 RepID=A0A835W6M0_CHLIN|nr:hypothetical protein HXX76_002583 [Chlamydomonas incerta]|eukprot:KAG2442497.1 hypothetical protein HXX76_002583 [Chlamydomonas incerta]
MFSAHQAPEPLLPIHQAPPHLHVGQSHGHNHGGHGHRGNGGSGGIHLSSYVKKNYVFILVACLVAVHTILFSTTTLLKSLPDGHVSAHVAIHQQVKLPDTLSSSFSGGAHSSSSSSSSSGKKKGGGKGGSNGTRRRLANARKKAAPGASAARRKLSRHCNVSAAPYEVLISNGQSFPQLESFVRTNILLLEDVGPASYFKMRRALSAPANGTGRGNATGTTSGSGGSVASSGSGSGGGGFGVDPGELDSLMFGFEAESPLLPLPRGLLPLFSHGPHDTACAMEQVRVQWETAHNYSGNTSSSAAPHLGPLILPDAEDAADSWPGPDAGLGHPQGTFFRASLPLVLQPSAEDYDTGGGNEQDGQATGQTGDAAAKAAGGGVADGQQDGESAEHHATVQHPEHLLFQADDRFRGGERFFPMRSMTKALVALTVLALQDEGQLEVAEPVYTYLPHWGHGVYSRMTVAHLLTHTAGYDNAYRDDLVLQPADITVTESARRTMGHINVTCEPGGRFWYSEIGYQVLGAVVEAVTGRGFHEVLEELVLVPAGMCNTRIINYFSDVVPSHGPLIDDCELAPASDAALRATAAGNTTARGTAASKAKAAKAKPAKTNPKSAKKDKAAGGWFSRRRLGAAAKGRWSSNPTLAIGGITTASDMGRLLGLLSNGGLAACCDGQAAAGATLTGAVGGGNRRRLLSTQSGGGSRIRAGGAATARPPPQAASSDSGGRRCVCGARVVSREAIASMLTRQFTPELESHPLVLGFKRTVGLNAALLEHMGILAPEARAAWSGQLWDDWGYGFGVWLSRSGGMAGAAELERENVFLFGSFNTVAALVSLEAREQDAAAARAAGSGEGGGDAGGVVEHGKRGGGRLAAEVAAAGRPGVGRAGARQRVALVSAGMGGVNLVSTMMLGYLAAAA